MTQPVRESWQVMYAAVFAIVIRDIQKKFIKSVNTQRSIAFIWIVLEPITHIGAWMMVRALMGRQFHTSMIMPMPLFILLGVMPFVLFRTIAGSSKGSIKGNKNFYLFRQIKPIDPLIAKLISELLISVLVFMVLLVGFTWLGVEWRVYNFLFWLTNIVSYLMFLLGVSLIIAIACFFFNVVHFFLNFIMRISYILSGVFFSAEALPVHLRDLMLCNPVFQFIELSRECFSPDFSYIPYGSASYLFRCGLITLMFGVALYLALRKKIMTEIEQR